MKSVVEGCQHVFVDGRQILNVALMANEIVDVFNTGIWRVPCANLIWRTPMIM